MRDRISKPLWQMMIEDHPAALRLLTKEKRLQLEKQMFDEMNERPSRFETPPQRLLRQR